MDSRECFPRPRLSLPQSGGTLAESIVASKLDGRLVDACELIDHDATLEIITRPWMMKDSRLSGIPTLIWSAMPSSSFTRERKSSSALSLIEDGFYYDGAYERPFTSEDLLVIEARMKALISRGYDVIKRMLPREKVICIFKQRGEDYKLRLVEDSPTNNSWVCTFKKNTLTCAADHMCSTPASLRHSNSRGWRAPTGAETEKMSSFSAFMAQLGPMRNN